MLISLSLHALYLRFIKRTYIYLQLINNSIPNVINIDVRFVKYDCRYLLLNWLGNSVIAIE